MTNVLIYVFISVYAFRLSAEDNQLMSAAGPTHDWNFLFFKEKDVYVMFMSVFSRFYPVRISLEKKFDADCKHTKHFRHNNVFSQVRFAPNHGKCCLFAIN